MFLVPQELKRKVRERGNILVKGLYGGQYKPQGTTQNLLLELCAQCGLLV